MWFTHNIREKVTHVPQKFPLRGVLNVSFGAIAPKAVRQIDSRRPSGLIFRIEIGSIINPLSIPCEFLKLDRW
jgi:hypothetical protein